MIAIGVLHQQELVGYWHSHYNTIVTHTIELYTDSNELDREFERAKLLLPKKYDDVEPIIVNVSVSY